MIFLLFINKYVSQFNIHQIRSKKAFEYFPRTRYASLVTPSPFNSCQDFRICEFADRVIGNPAG